MTLRKSLSTPSGFSTKNVKMAAKPRVTTTEIVTLPYEVSMAPSY